MNDTTSASALGKDYGYDVTLAEKVDETLVRFWLQSVARSLIPKERVATCLRHIAPNKNSVHIVRSPSRKRASFRNLLTCGAIWHCPVCAAKISERRAQELLAAVTHWHQNHGTVLLVTYTLRHNREQSLLHVLSTLLAALDRFKAGKGFQTIKKTYGIFGTIKGLETTHSFKNGWHPHAHELVFVESGFSIAGFQAAARQRWLDSVRAVGGDALYDIGLDVKLGDADVYEYVAKYGRLPKGTHWTVEREVAKAVSKKAAKGGRQPLQLLQDAGTGDAIAAGLWVEYARTMKGRNQLVWSKTLLKLLKTDKQESDEAIAAAVDDDAILLAIIDSSQWRALMRLPRDVRGELLEVAHRGNTEELRLWLLARNIVLSTAEYTGNDEKRIQGNVG